MTILDKVVAAVTPPESDADRAEARAKARAAAVQGGWLAMLLDHHLEIEAAFAAVKSATDVANRRIAQKHLAALLTGHSTAEETVIYPALALNGEKGHSTMAYTEQAATKVQLSALEDIDPLSQDYLDKLEHIRGAVEHHVYQEESNWFLDLQDKLPPAMQSKLGARYHEEFSRYMGSSSVPGVMSATSVSASMSAMPPTSASAPAL